MKLQACFCAVAALTLVVAQASNLTYCDKSVFARQHIAFSACITFKPGNEYFFSVDNYDSLEKLEEAVNNCERSPIPDGHMAIAREHSILLSPKEIRTDEVKMHVVRTNAKTPQEISDKASCWETYLRGDAGNANSTCKRRNETLDFGHSFTWMSALTVKGSKKVLIQKSSVRNKGIIYIERTEDLPYVDQDVTYIYHLDGKQHCKIATVKSGSRWPMISVVSKHDRMKFHPQFAFGEYISNYPPPVKNTTTSSTEATTTSIPTTKFAAESSESFSDLFDAGNSTLIPSEDGGDEEMDGKEKVKPSSNPSEDSGRQSNETSSTTAEAAGDNSTVFLAIMVISSIGIAISVVAFVLSCRGTILRPKKHKVDAFDQRREQSMVNAFN